MSIVYCVWFEEHGYYAKNQPNYEWSFTKDADQANVYRSLGGAYERGEEGDACCYGTYEIHEFVSSLEYIGAHEPSGARAAKREEERRRKEAAVAADKDPNEFTMHHIVAEKIRKILRGSFGDEWHTNPEAKAALLQSDGFDPEAVLLVMKEVL